MPLGNLPFSPGLKQVHLLWQLPTASIMHVTLLAHELTLRHPAAADLRVAKSEPRPDMIRVHSQNPFQMIAPSCSQAVLSAPLSDGPLTGYVPGVAGNHLLVLPLDCRLPNRFLDSISSQYDPPPAHGLDFILFDRLLLAVKPDALQLPTSNQLENVGPNWLALHFDQGE